MKMFNFKDDKDHATHEEIDVLTETGTPYQLIVWNDEVNTFEWVIETLVEVCDHSSIQAEQCSLIIHYKGKCEVKKGDFDFLEPLKTAILDRQISATIEKTYA